MKVMPINMKSEMMKLFQGQLMCFILEKFPLLNLQHYTSNTSMKEARIALHL